MFTVTSNELWSMLPSRTASLPVQGERGVRSGVFAVSDAIPAAVAFILRRGQVPRLGEARVLSRHPQRLFILRAPVIAVPLRALVGRPHGHRGRDEEEEAGRQHGVGAEPVWMAKLGE